MALTKLEGDLSEASDEDAPATKRQKVLLLLTLDSGTQGKNTTQQGLAESERSAKRQKGTDSKPAGQEGGSGD